MIVICKSGVGTLPATAHMLCNATSYGMQHDRLEALEAYPTFDYECMMTPMVQLRLMGFSRILAVVGFARIPDTVGLARILTTACIFYFNSKW